jgi:hypothetical protein
VRQSILVGSRYMKLLNDGMDFRMVIEGSRVSVRLGARVHRALTCLRAIRDDSEAVAKFSSATRKVV